MWYIDLTTLEFGQYSRLAVRFNIFQFSAINSKTDLKFEKISI